MNYSISLVMHGACRLASFLALATLVYSLPAFGATWQVATSGIDDPTCGVNVASACRTIQYTITNIAASGDTIVLQPGTYSEHISVTKNLTLQGSGSSIIDGSNSGTVVNIPSGKTVTLDQLVIQNGSATASFSSSAVAAGISNQGALVLSNSIVQNNQLTAQTALPYPVAGGIDNSGTLTLISTSVVNNSGFNGCYNAGGVNSSSGTMTIQNSYFSGNTASSGGCSGPGTSNPDGIRANQGTISQTYLDGNGMTIGGAVTITQSTITGPIDHYYSRLTVTNSTLTSRLTLDVRGSTYGTADIRNSTVGYISFGVPASSSILNSILSGCSGTFISGDYNILPSGCSFVGGGHDLVGVSPNLGPLANNGGSTPTQMPQPGSPAIDGGNPSGCTDSAGNLLLVDQRNLPRSEPPAGTCDIGAVEVQ